MTQRNQRERITHVSFCYFFSLLCMNVIQIAGHLKVYQLPSKLNVIFFSYISDFVLSERVAALSMLYCLLNSLLMGFCFPSCFSVYKIHGLRLLVLLLHFFSSLIALYNYSLSLILTFLCSVFLPLLLSLLLKSPGFLRLL